MYGDKKLCRTFFHQLIDGIEYLHSQNLAHMDLKLENLVLGDDFKLKIIDFDLAISLTDEKNDQYGGAGTKNYRAPEVRAK